jgi:hypothetical protein
MIGQAMAILAQITVAALLVDRLRQSSGTS